jgi:hypothetical protein
MMMVMTPVILNLFIPGAALTFSYLLAGRRVVIDMNLLIFYSSLIEMLLTSINPMALQPKSGLGLLL